MNREHTACTLGETLEVIVGKWKISILFLLFQGTQRFSEMQHAIPGITKKMLTAQLRELEEHDIVRRIVYAAVPPKVEYSLTEYGLTLEPILDSLNLWGSSHAEHMRAKKATRAQTASEAAHTEAEAAYAKAGTAHDGSRDS